MAFTLPIIPPATWELYKKYWQKIIKSSAPEHLIILEKDSILMFGYTKEMIKWTVETKTMGCITAYTWNPSKCSTVVLIELPHLSTGENLQEVQSWIDWWRPETSIYFRSEKGTEGKCFIQTENWTWLTAWDTCGQENLNKASKLPCPVITEKAFSPFTIKPSRINQ